MMKRWWGVPLLLFALLLLHGSLLGLTDDEAYYWVLAQRPALGYAFHPPAIGLSVALSQWLFGGIFGHHSVMLVRLPAAFCSAAMVALGIRWMERAGGGPASRGRGALALVALAGIFALSWMIVPDMPLFLGWTLSFVSAWEVCFATVEEFSAFNYVFLCAGVMLAILSKYSGVLGAFSALMCVGVWAPQNRRRKGVLYVVLGGVGAALPILWWNAHHEWASILYQIKERHGDAHISALRYLRFWLIELVLAGPALVLFGIGVLRRWVGRRAARVESYVMLWVLPGAAIFFSQPLWSDFKPHWALIVWWPLALALAWSIAKNGMGRLGRVHLGYGLSVIAFVLLACHIPVGGWVMSKLRSGPLDPRLDVTNDLYGWSDLRSFLAEKGALGVPILGSRYQTAGQAAFAMSGDERVTLLPRDLKAMDEWADLGVSIGQGPAWPKLTTTILFVTDNRYDAGPEYPGANCRKEWTLEKARAGFLAKTITIWKCVP